MLNKLPIGQVADAAHVGGGGSGNDQQNKEALGNITQERKRPRYSVFAMAAHGPNFYSPAGVWDLLTGAGGKKSKTTTEEAPYDFSVLTGAGIESDVFKAKIDGGATQEIAFNFLTAFADPSNATADEVAAVLDALSGASAAVVDGDKVKIESDDSSGSVEVEDTVGNLIFAFPLGGMVEPNRVDPGESESSFANGAGHSMHLEYEAREPIVFLGGQLFIGEVTPQALGGALTGSTAIHVEKVDASDSSKVLSIDTHTHNHSFKQGPNEDNKDILVEVPGSRSQFSNGERFRFRVVPNGAGYNVGTHGLRGVSAVLWFKALHR